MDEAGASDRPRPGASRLVAVTVGVVLLAFVAVLFTRQPEESRFGPSQILGKAVPEVRGTTLDGATVDVDRLRGKWVVVNFFATWCVPCIQEHPELVRFVEAHRATGDAEVVSVAFSDTEPALRAFFEQRGGDWPVIVGDTGATAIAFGVTGVPESYVVDPTGRVVAKFEGVTRAELDRVIGANDGGGASTGAGATPTTSSTSSTSPTLPTPSTGSGDR